MSVERELLNRCAVTLRVRDICPLLLKEISELLNEPEQKPEPLSGKWWYDKGVEDTKYFLKREPLSADRLAQLYGVNLVNDVFIFARQVEMAHGIGVTNE